MPSSRLYCTHITAAVRVIHMDRNRKTKGKMSRCIRPGIDDVTECLSMQSTFLVALETSLRALPSDSSGEAWRVTASDVRLTNISRKSRVEVKIYQGNRSHYIQYTKFTNRNSAILFIAFNQSSLNHKN